MPGGSRSGEAVGVYESQGTSGCIVELRLWGANAPAGVEAEEAPAEADRSGEREGGRERESEGEGGGGRGGGKEGERTSKVGAGDGAGGAEDAGGEAGEGGGLERLVLRVTFDGAATPQVVCLVRVFPCFSSASHRSCV